MEMEEDATPAKVKKIIHEGLKKATKKAVATLDAPSNEFESEDEGDDKSEVVTFRTTGSKNNNATILERETERKQNTAKNVEMETKTESGSNT